MKNLALLFIVATLTACHTSAPNPPTDPSPSYPRGVENEEQLLAWCTDPEFPDRSARPVCKRV